MIDGAVGIAGDLFDPSVLDVNLYAASSMTHAAVALDHGVVPVDFHFTI
jgi:hypothetical protein